MTPQWLRAAAALALALGAAPLAGSCDRAREERAPHPEAPAPAPAPAPALALPPAGETRVERRGDRYAVAASEATPLAALTELSMHAGFRIERGAGALPDEPRTLWLSDVSLERAVAAILAGVPHHVHHEPVDGDLDPARPLGGRPVALARVTVGTLAGAAAPERADGGRGGEPREGDAGARGPRARELPAASDDPAERELREALARDARDPDAAVRLDAVDRMDPDADRVRLAAMLRDDPSAEVRAAAAEVVAEGDPFAATPDLLAALADPDPAVVAAAVGALEDVYDEAPDPRIREGIAALRDHRDADVREAAEEFAEWIEE